MKHPRKFLLRLLVLAPLLLLSAAARADDGPGTDPRAPEAIPAVELVRRWLAAPPERRVVLEAALRVRGPTVLPALAAAAKDHEGDAGERLRRLILRVREDWFRKSAPAGMVFVPAGPVELPREKAPWGPAGRRVPVQGFYIDRTEVVVEEWRRWLAHLRAEGESAERERSLWEPPAEMSGSMPVVRVRWTQAETFAREWRQGRLPTAEEFERALRGSGLATYPWGNEMCPGCANLSGHGPDAPLPVGLHPRGASVFGVQDLVGNVAEWSATTVVQGRSGRYPLVMGGSFQDVPGPALTWRGLGRNAARLDAHEARNWLGFRVVRDLPEAP